MVTAIRRACPGTLIGVSTGAWIEGNEDRTRALISKWKVLPDYASVNLSEQDAPAIIALLGELGVGVEAGLASTQDARRFVALGEYRRPFRILIEIEEQSVDLADRTASEITQILFEAGLVRPILLHGFDATVWQMIRRARQMRWSTRVGL